VQLALDRDRAGCVLVEHRDVALLGRPRGDEDALRAYEPDPRAQADPAFVAWLDSSAL
jgi:hypothetical protein